MDHKRVWHKLKPCISSYTAKMIRHCTSKETAAAAKHQCVCD